MLYSKFDFTYSQCNAIKQIFTIENSFIVFWDIPLDDFTHTASINGCFVSNQDRI